MPSTVPNYTFSRSPSSAHYRALLLDSRKRITLAFAFLRQTSTPQMRHRFSTVAGLQATPVSSR
jgi:hypothetical protein